MLTNVDTAKKLLTVLSFCSGYGGIERGLDLAGFKHRTIAYVEIEAYAIANLANKMERGELLPAAIWSNLKTLPVQPFRDKVDLITGGYPCQPFSAAGRRLGEEDPRHLWPYIRRHIESIRPVRCFFENVEGHISLGLREVISDLESLGYKTTWGIFSAREVGAPHQRKRVYILAYSKHNGSLTTAVRGGFNKASDNDEKRSHESVQFTGSSQPHGSSDLQESDKLGYSQSSRFSRRPTNIKRERPKNIGERSDKDLRSEFERSSQTLADSNGCRGRKNQQQAELRTIGTEQSPRSSWKEVEQGEVEQIQRWPSRPGEAQYGWESSRTIKRGVGGASDGCANRVDRIRLLGNGVVPQTAAKAWITLNDRLK
jgi:DNA (cytosine-5)-methyltransferase 1